MVWLPDSEKVTQVRSMCSWTLPCASSLAHSILHLSHGFQCSPTLNRHPYEGRLPLTSWWRKSSNMTVGQSRPISLTHHFYDWHPGSRCGWTCNQPTSKVDGRHNWKSAQVVNSHLVCDPTIRKLGFDLPHQQWSLLNHFRTEQGHCSVCRRKWRLTDTNLCPCGETQTMSDIVESCPLTKLNGGLSWLHSADEDAVSWLTNYGSRHAHEMKKKWKSLMIHLAVSTECDRRRNGHPATA